MRNLQLVVAKNCRCFNLGGQKEGGSIVCVMLQDELPCRMIKVAFAVRVDSHYHPVKC